VEYIILGLIVLAIPVLGVWGFFRTLSQAARIEELTAQVARLDARLAQLALAGIPQAEVKPSEATAPAAAPEEEEAAEPEAVSVPESEPTEAEAPPSAPAEPIGAGEAIATPGPTPALPVAARSLEETLGTRWAVWAGGLALALGGVFLVRYAIEQGWFGPVARIVFGALFATALLAGGEWMRRREQAGRVLAELGGFQNANIPAIITAAGTVAAFATVYAAHALYELIGPASAFVLLALIGLATMALAVLHHPGLAALGLVGALASPLLVESSNPQPWPVVGLVAVTVTAAYALARIRVWLWLALAAAAGGAVWGALFVAGLDEAQLSATMTHLVIQSALAAWVFGAVHRGVEDPNEPDLPAIGVLLAFAVLAGLVLLDGPPTALSTAVFASFVATIMAANGLAAPAISPVALYGTGTIAAALLGWPVAAELAGDGPTVLPGRPGGVPLPDAVWFFSVYAALAGAAMGAAGWLRLMRANGLGRVPSGVYAAFGVLSPVVVLVVAWWRIKQFDASLPFGLVALGVAGAMAFAALQLQRTAPAMPLQSPAEPEPEPEPIAEGETEAPVTAPRPAIPAQLIGLEAFAAGALAALAIGLTMVLDKGSLTIALALAALGAAWVTTRTGLGLLRRAVGAMGVIVLARLIENPTLVGGDLGSTIIFNWLLWGYGVPALAFAAASVVLRRQRDDEVVAICEGLAMVFAWFLVSLEIRHALTGAIDTRTASHLELGIQVTASLAFAIAIVRIETVRRSAVLRIGSYVFGALSLGGGIFGLLIAENPLFGDRVVGGAIFNSLLIGYLLPAIAAFALAWSARGRRPQWFVMAAAALGFVLQFAYTVLEIRRIFQGANLAIWRHTPDAELYTYSAVFLVIGIALLAWGILRQSRIVRLVSAGYVLLAVGKVFLVDMAGLTGALRALSFIGLGFVLVGIGLVYQKLVFGQRSPPLPPATPEPEAPAQA
jgi:uncharacterized membrane protein